MLFNSERKAERYASTAARSAINRAGRPNWEASYRARQLQSFVRCAQNITLRRPASVVISANRNSPGLFAPAHQTADCSCERGGPEN